MYHRLEPQYEQTDSWAKNTEINRLNPSLFITMRYKQPNTYCSYIGLPFFNIAIYYAPKHGINILLPYYKSTFLCVNILLLI